VEADLQRLKRELEEGRKAVPNEHPAWKLEVTQAVVLGGSVNLEVVGESHYQDNLWQLVGSDDRSERVRVKITAVLAAEPDNPCDANAVAVWIDGLKVGHLSQDDAQLYRAGLLALQEEQASRWRWPGSLLAGAQVTAVVDGLACSSITTHKTSASRSGRSASGYRACTRETSVIDTP
jgi:hypothetical protein